MKHGKHPVNYVQYLQIVIILLETIAKFVFNEIITIITACIYG